MIISIPCRFFFLLSLAACLFCAGPISVYGQSPGQSPGQGPLRSLANTKDWQKVSSEFFDVYYAGDSRSAATRVARYAEVARYELGQLYDFRPESRYTLFYFDDLPRQVLTHTRTEEVEKLPGIFPMPKLEAAVVHPGSNSELVGEVKRKVAYLILKEFSHGHRLGMAIQNQMVLNNAPWFSKGLTDFVGQGWTYEDEMWLNDVPSEEILDLALEGNSRISQVLRKSVWQYIAHEYGEQKLAEIIYLVNISHSLETGVISVLGITLNTLTDRWREFILSQSQANVKGRTPLGKVSGLKEIPLKAAKFRANRADKKVKPIASGKKENANLLGFTFNSSKNLYALYLNKEGKHTVVLQDAESGKLIPTGIRSSFANVESEGKKMAYPMAWSRNGNLLVTTAYEGHTYQYVLYNLETEELIKVPVGNQFDRILSFDWSHSGSKLVISALKKGRTDIYIGTLSDGQASFNALTDDGYDDLDPVWSFDDQQIFFSSNRDSLRLDQHGPQWESLTNDFDIFAYHRGEGADSLTQLTFTEDTNEGKPAAFNSFEVMYLTDESGVPNLKKVNIFLGETAYVSNLAQGIFDYEVTEKQLVFSSPISGVPSLFASTGMTANVAATPALTMLRMEKKALFREKEKARLKAELEKVKKEQAVVEEEVKEQVQVQVEEEEIEEKEVNEEEQKEKPRYYIFDEEDVPYESKSQEEEAFERKERARKYVLPTIFGDKPKPKFGEVKVSGPESVKSRWAADYTGLYVGRRADAGYYLGVGAGFSDQLNNQFLEVRAIPFVDFGNFRGKNGEAWIKYSNVKGKFDFSGELFADLRHFRRKLLPDNQGNTLDTTIYRSSRASLRGTVTYPVSNFAAWNAQLGFQTFGFDKIQPNANQQLDVLSQRDYLVSAGISYTYNKAREREGFYYKGFVGEVGVESLYGIKAGRLYLPYRQDQCEKIHHCDQKDRVGQPTAIGLQHR